jgi:hypothetical protein
MTTTFADPVSPAITRSAPAAQDRHQAGRMDLYVSIHKALRSFMTDTLTRVGRIDVADVADRDEALGQLDELLALCLDHLRHENEFIHAAIEARQPAGSRRIADEHVEHAESIGALKGEAAALRATSGADAERLAMRLYRHLALFVAENFQHMHIEETVHNALLWQHFSDAELGALHGRLMASIPAHEHLLVSRWMLPASTPGERAMIAGAAKAAMPPEALLGVMSVIRPHLDDKGWAKLAAAIGIDPDLGRA